MRGTERRTKRIINLDKAIFEKLLIVGKAIFAQLLITEKRFSTFPRSRQKHHFRPPAPALTRILARVNPPPPMFRRPPLPLLLDALRVYSWARPGRRTTGVRHLAALPLGRRGPGAVPRVSVTRYDDSVVDHGDESVASSEVR